MSCPDALTAAIANSAITSERLTRSLRPRSFTCFLSYELHIHFNRIGLRFKISPMVRQDCDLLSSAGPCVTIALWSIAPNIEKHIRRFRNLLQRLSAEEFWSE